VFVGLVRFSFDSFGLASGQNIKARLWHPAFSGFNQCRRFVETAAVSPAVRPPGPIVNAIQGWGPLPQTGHDLGQKLNGLDTGWPDGSKFGSMVLPSKGRRELPPIKFLVPFVASPVYQ
jgi:hypothetical protein